MLEERVKKAEWMPKCYNRDFNEGVFLESIDKIYLLHYVCMREVCYMCELIDRKEISETVNIIFTGLRYIFELLSDSYVRKSEELLEIKNSTRIRYIEHPDRPLRLDLTLQEIDAARNARSKELDEEDKKRRKAPALPDDIMSSLQGVGALLSGQGSDRNYKLNFADAEEEVERELREKQRVKDAVEVMVKAMDKGQPIDYYTIDDPKIIVEFNNHVYGQLLLDNHRQQESLRKTILEYEGFTNTDLKTPGELHRLILMNSKIVENLQLNKLEFSMAGNEEDPNAIFKDAEADLYKTFDDKQRDLVNRVISIVKRSYEKPKSSKQCITAMTSKEIDSLWYTSTTVNTSKDTRKEIAQAMAEIEKLTGRLERSKEEYQTAQKIIQAKDKLIMSLTDNIDQLKSLKRVKTPEEDNIKTMSKQDSKKQANNELGAELDKAIEILKKTESQLDSKTKELEGLKKRSETMYQALDHVRKLASKQGVMRVGAMSDLQVITKIEQVLSNLEEKIKQQEEVIENNVLDDSLLLDVGNGKKVFKPVKMKHVVIDAKLQPFMINSQASAHGSDEVTVQERDSYVSRSMTKGSDRKLPLYDTVNTKPEEKDTKKPKPSQLKISLVSIAIIHPKKNPATIAPTTTATLAQVTTTKTLPSPKNIDPQLLDSNPKKAGTKQKGQPTNEAGNSKNTGSKAGKQVGVGKLVKNQQGDKKPGARKSVDTAKNQPSKSRDPSLADPSRDTHGASDNRLGADYIDEGHEGKAGSGGQTRDNLATVLDQEKEGDRSAQPLRGLSKGQQQNTKDGSQLKAQHQSTNKEIISKMESGTAFNHPGFDAVALNEDLDLKDLLRLMRELKETGESILVKCMVSRYKVILLEDSQTQNIDLPNISRSNSNHKIVSKEPLTAGLDRRGGHPGNNVALPTIKESNKNHPASSRFLENRSSKRTIPNEDRVYIGSQKRHIESVFSQMNSAKETMPTTHPATHVHSVENPMEPTKRNPLDSVRSNLTNQFTTSRNKNSKTPNEGVSERLQTKLQGSYHRRNLSTHVIDTNEGGPHFLKKSRSQKAIELGDEFKDFDEKVSHALMTKNQSVVSLAQYEGELSKRLPPSKSMLSLDAKDRPDDDPHHYNSSVISKSQLGNFPVEYQVYVPIKDEMVPDSLNILVDNQHEDDQFLEKLYSGMSLKGLNGENIANFEAVGHQITIPTLKQFKTEVRKFVESHSRCGPNCSHLKRFYERCGLSFFPKSISTNKQPYIFPIVDMMKKVSKTDLQKDIVMQEEKIKRKDAILKNLAKKPVFI